MPNFKELVTFEYESAYDLSVKKNFSIPKIYSANGDLQKRWYVYFSFRDPKSGKLKRQTPFYGNANTYKTKEDRQSILVTYRKVLLRLLKQGYDPYSDNTALHRKLTSKNNVTVDPVTVKKEIKDLDLVDEKPKLTVQEAFDFGIQLKEKVVNQVTKTGYENKIKLFLEWLKKIGRKLNISPKSIKWLLPRF